MLLRKFDNTNYLWPVPKWTGLFPASVRVIVCLQYCPEKTMSDRKSVPALHSSAFERRKPVGQSVFGKLFFKESFCAWIFIAPALLGFTVFYLFPCIRALYISLTDWNLLRAAKFIGPANYSRLWNDPNFWNAMRVTVSM